MKFCAQLLLALWCCGCRRRAGASPNSHRRFERLQPVDARRGAQVWVRPQAVCLKQLALLGCESKWGVLLCSRIGDAAASTGSDVSRASARHLRVMSWPIRQSPRKRRP
ncbi:hypothetical protein EJ04DRAFT_310975 [Polyplosphaeria fusca]|uniref:Secreted protein n=1 Tax=Polyplosphaeria fusca TaxID=682080 RepID=A0A9P4R501_9PLEO|nr:hypothetical protein EJ04DRAFT_310975 [Polyplosphaeria fusca]